MTIAHKRNAFTWIELAVVLSITLVLALILLPVFNRTHCGGNPADCQSNEKQMGLAFLQYCQDYDNKLPPLGPAVNPSPLGRPAGWAGMLWPYLQSTRPFRCPSVPRDPNPAHGSRIDYGYNEVIAGRPKNALWRPAHTVLLFEASAADGVLQHAATPESDRVAVARHYEGSNYLFADGHVKWLQSAKCPGTAPATDGNFTFAS